MIQKRFVSLLLCAALALCLLAGCDTAASGSTGSASAPANSSASASSENIPSTTNEANTSGLRPNFDENSLFSITGTSDAFEPCLGWGPGVSGCSLKSVLAAASLLQWAEQTNLTSRTTDAIEDAFSQWYDALDSMDQESFAEAWPLIKDDANALLTDKDSLSGRIEDAGLDPADLPGCSEKNWDALQDVIDRLTPRQRANFEQHAKEASCSARCLFLPFCRFRLFSAYTSGCPCRSSPPAPEWLSTRCSGWNP